MGHLMPPHTLVDELNRCFRSTTEQQTRALLGQVALAKAKIRGDRWQQVMKVAVGNVRRLCLQHLPPQ